MEHFLKYVQNFLDLVERLLVGEFWFPIGKLPNESEKLILEGDRSAIPRNNPHWREQWKWVILKAQHAAPYGVPFHIYFESPHEGVCKRYFKKIRTPYVAMRVGPDVVVVTATYTVGHGDDVMHLDVFLKPDREPCIKEALAKHFLSHKVTWT